MGRYTRGMSVVLNDGSTKKTAAQVAACLSLWVWAGIDWVAGFWLMVAGYEDRIIRGVLNTTGAVGFFMMVIGLAMFLWGFQVAVWGTEMLRRREGLVALLLPLVRGVLVLGCVGIFAGLAFWMHAKFVRHVSIRGWILLALPVVGLVVLLLVTHEVLRWAGKEEGARGAASGEK